MCFLGVFLHFLHQPSSMLVVRGSSKFDHWKQRKTWRILRLCGLNADLCACVVPHCESVSFNCHTSFLAGTVIGLSLQVDVPATRAATALAKDEIHLWLVLYVSWEKVTHKTETRKDKGASGYRVSFVHQHHPAQTFTSPSLFLLLFSDFG